MSRRLVISALAVVGSLALASAAGIAFRLPLVAWLTERELADLGIGNAELTVEEVGWDEVRFTGVRAGETGELRLDELTAGYRPTQLLLGRLERLTVKGLSLRLDLTGERAALGSLQAPLDDLMARPGGDPGADRALPEITLEAGLIEASTPFGPATLAIDGRIQPGDERSIETELDLILTGTTGELKARLAAERTVEGAVAGELRVDQGSLSIGDDQLAAEVLDSKLDFAWHDSGLERLNADLSLQGVHLAGGDLGAAGLHVEADDRDFSARVELGPQTGGFDLRAQLDLEDFLGEPAVAAELELSAAAEAPIWRLADLPPPESGTASVAFKVSGDLPPVLTLEKAPGRWLSWLWESRLEGEAQIELRDVTLPDQVSRLSAVVPVEAELDRGHLDLTLRLDAGLDTAGPPARWLAELGLPPEMLGPRLAVKLDAEDGESLELRLTPREKEMAFELNGAFSLNAEKHLALSLAGDLQGAVDRSWTLTDLAADGLALNAQSQQLAGTPITALALTSLVAVDLTNDTGRLEHEVAAASNEFSFRVRRDGEPPLTIKGNIDNLTLSGSRAPDGSRQGEVVLKNGGLTVPELALAFRGLSATLPAYAASPEDEIRFRVASIKSLGQPVDFHPLSLTGQLRPRGANFDVAVEVTGPEDIGRMTIAGWFNPAEARGDLRGVLTPLAFAPDDIQPSDLSPLLARLERVSGTVEGETQIAWDAKKQRSKAVIVTSGLSFELDDIAFERLRFGLRLDDLSSPSSPPEQLLSARKIDIGVPLKDVSVRFQVLDGQGPRVRVERADFATLGGRFRLEDAVIDPAQARQTLELQVVELELAELFDAIQIEGLTGRGRIAGVIPITIGPDGVAVPDAALAERSPGLLQFNSPVTAQALKSGGEPVELMLQALEDFRYESLKLTGEKAADGEVRLRLELQGKNPGVLQGRSFHFNINLTGNLHPLLSAIAQGRKLSTDLLGKTWRLRQ